MRERERGKREKTAAGPAAQSEAGGVGDGVDTDVNSVVNAAKCRLHWFLSKGTSRPLQPLVILLFTDGQVKIQAQTP